MCEPLRVGTIEFQTKMSNRASIMKYIHRETLKVKNIASRDERFELLENIELLTSVLETVVNFENKLISDLDVD